MKKALLLNLFLALSLSAFVACNDDGTDYDQPTMTIDGADEFGARTLDFTNKAGSQQFEMTANNDWFIRIPDDASEWLAVTPAEGSAADGPITVTVDAKANDNTEERSATLAFVCNGIEQKALLTVVQQQLYYLTASANKSMINKDGGDVVLTVDTNADWTYVIDDAGKTWLTEKEKSATKLTLTASVLDVEERSAQITVTSSVDPELTAVIKLSQKDIELYASAAKAYVSPQGGEVTLDVTTTNVPEWDVETDDSWITAVKVGDDKIKISATAFGTSRREGTVKLTTPVDAEMVYPVTVVQRANSSAPKADVLDVVFGEDGTAQDVAAGRTVIYNAGDNLSISYSNVYLRYVPTFAYSPNSTVTDSYYRIDYDDQLRSTLEDGFTMETVFMAGKLNTSAEVKAFSSTSSGGTALMLKNGQIAFIINDGGTKSAWKWAYSGIDAEVGVYYHVVGVYNKDEGAIYVYVNGEQKAKATADGTFRHSQLASPYFTIGGNSSNDTKINGTWNGEISVARIYGEPLTADEVKALYEDVRP